MSNSERHQEHRRCRAKQKEKENNMHRPKRKPASLRVKQRK